VAMIVEQRLASADAFKIAGVMSGVIAVAFAATVVAIAGTFNFMHILLTALAVVLSVRVYRHPEEAIAAGPLFLLASNVFLPSSARVNAEIRPWEMYYWAVGIFLITGAACWRLGCRVLFELPRSLQVFLLVAIAASVYGFTHGSEPSYVLRQLYGSLLLGAYFALGLHSMGEASFLRVLRPYGVACALAFLVYYAFLFGELGVHKEMSSLGTQAAMLAILFAVRGGWKWWLAAGIMLLVPLLLVERRGLAGFTLAMVLMWAFRAKSRALRTGSWLLAGVIVVVSLAPPYVGMILDTLTGSSTFDELIPEGSRDESTVQERGAQLAQASVALQRSPVFGSGMGAVFDWESPVQGQVATAYVDNGWAYLLTKTGLAGLLAFGWFVVTLITWMPGSSVPIRVCLLSVLLLVMFAEPVFFHFSTSPFVGAMAGLVYAKRRGLSAES